ncbi:MAG: acetyl-CoA hydrolase [Clostridiales bacterium]|nr:acetyl-CoA hydrolase [Clostridiales bacterium]
MALQFDPMRSWIFTDVVKEEYRHKLLYWHMLHVADSIAQFAPYVSKYSFYQAMPVPPEGERFGTVKFHLCEHYWNINPFTEEMGTKAYCEYMPVECLKWQGTIPDDDAIDSTKNLSGDEGRSTGGEEGTRPFVFAFLPLSWEQDLKGKERTVMDGPNYRWHFVIRYPDGVTEEEGDRWLFEEVLPEFCKAEEVTRILTSKIRKDVNGCGYSRAVEMWFDGPEEWYRVCVEKMSGLPKPSWAQQDKFPFLKPHFHISSIFTPDIPYSDNMTQYRGIIPMR